MSRKARAALIYQHGPAETFSFEDVDVPDPVDNEVLVRNTVIGLNFVDVYYRRGTFPVPSFPAIIGNEAAGIVEAVGRNVTSVKVGDRVVYANGLGAYTTARLYPADRLTIIPEGISDDQAASSFLKALTARYLVKEVVPLKPGDTVLYHAAAGGVGLIFVQWATSLGIRVIGTVSTKEKARLALEAGCVAVINYNTEDFVARTFALTGGVGVKAVFDSVGKDTFKGSLEVLKPRGALVQFGKASGSPEPIDPFELAPRSLYLTWPILPHYNGTIEELATSAAEIFAAIKSGVLKVDPTNVYRFDQLVDAHRDLEQRRTVGASVLHI
jgi:NADPH:quinone reductase